MRKSKDSQEKLVSWSVKDVQQNAKLPENNIGEDLNEGNRP
jgi:hypothetical protein